MNGEKRYTTFTYLIFTASCLIESETFLELAAKFCHVDGSLGIIMRFFVELITLHELSISLLPASIIGCCAWRACIGIFAGTVTNSLELAYTHKLSTASMKICNFISSENTLKTYLLYLIRV